ncbi:MAG: hypothetical protein K6E36_06655 [Oscillospiraceae bacterium]|nr:hypothetical protein [Oscillospiraceae bacterium]
MLRNLFDQSESPAALIVQAPDSELLESIRTFNQKADRAEKNIKRAALAFSALTAVLWIGGDLAGISSDLVLTFGLLAIFGWLLILAAGAIWLNRPSRKKYAARLSESALAQMHIPDGAVEIEMLFPKNPADFGRRSDLRWENRFHLFFADAEALYIADVTGTAKIPYALTEPWTQADSRAEVRSWIQSSRASAYAKAGVQKKSRLLSLIPVIGMFLPDHYLIPYCYSVVHTAADDYLLCIPVYETEKLPNPGFQQEPFS